MKRLVFAPQLFAAWMEGRKDVTRRLVRGDKPRYKEGEIVRVVTSWQVPAEYDDCRPSELCQRAEALFRLDGIPLCIGGQNEDGSEEILLAKTGKLRPGRFVPKGLEAYFPRARIGIVTQERLQRITKYDCLREGCPSVRNQNDGPEGWFRALWESIHTKKGERWVDNPLVWRVRINKED
ncbi:MAG: hypothetical protein JW704_00680 [Anaerolineaceae bacterium]|nr:hypothetical protein [Anaerolineaceae bacterium]